MSDERDRPDASTGKAAGKITPAKFAHVVLRTSSDRLSALAGWYKTVLEGEALYENAQLAFIADDKRYFRKSGSAISISGLRHSGIDAGDPAAVM